MKLYKFRSLGDMESFGRAERILTTGDFWCSSLWEQNDPMEGVFTYLRGQCDEHLLARIFSVKNQYRICSFSSVSAVKRPTMWGYYANGFKGVAIEVEIASSCVSKVNYLNGPKEWLKEANRYSEDDGIKRILTTKLKQWKDEHEYRYLIKGETGFQKVGRVTGVYFGNPYCGVENIFEVFRNSPGLQCYSNHKARLIEIARAHGYSCYSASIGKTNEEWKVQMKDLRSSDQQ